MITGTVSTWGRYRHRETGKVYTVRDTELHVKTDRHWQTCIEYEDETAGARFAVPLDDFRQRFEEVNE